MERFATLFEAFSREGAELYMVGGCVRDLLMEREPKDYDFATSATPSETKQILKRNGFRVFPIGEKFGTIATKLGGEEVEITTYRVKESYTKGSRKPRVVFGTELAVDLGRRDLTINAMAMGSGGEVVDPFGGQRDLEVGRLRVPGGGFEKTLEIFGDDPLRMLRVGRFVGRYGFAPDEDTTAAAEAMADTILTVSRERWKDELSKILCEPRALEGLRWLGRVRVMQFCLPELAAMPFDSEDWQRTERVIEAVDRSLGLMRWVALLHGVGRPAARRSGSDRGYAMLGEEIAEGICRRLRFSNEEREAVCFLVRNHRISESPSWDQVASRKLALEAGSLLAPLMELVRAWAQSEGGEVAVRARDWMVKQREDMAVLLSEGPLEPILPKGLGNVLSRELGVKRGRGLGDLMNWLKDEIVCGRVPNEAKAAVYVEAVREHLQTAG